MSSHYDAGRHAPTAPEAFSGISADAVRSTTYLDPELHQALRLKAAHGRRSMSEIVNDALRQTLREEQEDLARRARGPRRRGGATRRFWPKLKADRKL